MNPKDLLAKTAKIKEEREALREYWITVLPEEYLPPDRQFSTWLSMYPPFDNVAESIEKCANWFNRCYVDFEEGRLEDLPTKGQLIRYVSGIMVKGKRDEERS